MFGKTIENIWKHVNVELVASSAKMEKLVAKPTFKSAKRFNPLLEAVDTIQEKLLLNKPVYTNFAVLDLSKVLMYQFHYQYIKHKYAEWAQLLFTDTDSLCYQVNTEDFYHDIQPDLDLFDTADYPSYHTLHSTVNKEVIDKFKDETAGHPIREFVGLHPKMYQGWTLALARSPRRVSKVSGECKSQITRPFGECDFSSSRNWLNCKINDVFYILFCREISKHKLTIVHCPKNGRWSATLGFAK